MRAYPHRVASAVEVQCLDVGCRNTAESAELLGLAVVYVQSAALSANP